MVQLDGWLLATTVHAVIRKQRAQHVRQGPFFSPQHEKDVERVTEPLADGGAPEPLSPSNECVGTRAEIGHVNNMQRAGNVVRELRVTQHAWYIRCTSDTLVCASYVRCEHNTDSR